MFNASYYNERYAAEVRASGLDPAIHFLRIGGHKGYPPSAEFDASAYLTNYPDVAAAKINPLVHYLLHGRGEGRLVQKVLPLAPPPKAPELHQWNELSAELAADASPPAEVDVVVPVYRGFDETANCLFRILQSRKSGKVFHDVVVIDDATPELRIAQLLDQLEKQKLITLVRNPDNRGFVASVNAGMRLHPDRDVILLNSDTEVFGDWVDRLRRATYAAPDIGTATPLSNNATICSYPNFAGNYQGDFEVSFEGLDRLACNVNAGKTVDMPTAIGFCMYIRRECLEQAGYFDEAAFGLGYGEENDFSLRIAQRGWRNVLAGDVFVRHIGQVSFLDSTDVRVKQGLQIIQERFPHYLPAVAVFIKNDPARELRRNLDVARLRRNDRSVLFVLSNLEEGARRHVSDLAARLRAEGVNGLLLQPSPRGEHFALITAEHILGPLNTLEIDMRQGMDETCALLRDLAVRHIHLHHTRSVSPEVTGWIQRLRETCGLSYDVTLHDKFPSPIQGEGAGLGKDVA